MAFREVLTVPVIANEYSDGTSQRAKQADTPRRRWQLGRRLPAAKIIALREFWLARRGVEAFYFYNPYQPAPGAAIGSNYDAAGGNPQGRYIVVFAPTAWQQSAGFSRADVQIELIEVA